MARKKKHPSFEIPEAVRHAGQAGWVYRSGKAAPTTRHAAPKRSVVRIATLAVAAAPKAAALPAPTVVPASAPAAAAAPSSSMTGRLVGLGLQVAAVPFVVPLFLTAAVSRRLGLSDRG